MFFPPPPDVHAFKDYLTTSEIQVVLSILQPTCGMGNNKKEITKTKKMINKKGTKVVEYSLVDKDTIDQMLKQISCLKCHLFLVSLEAP
jgi:hypothetical protein